MLLLIDAICQATTCCWLPRRHIAYTPCHTLPIISFSPLMFAAMRSALRCHFECYMLLMRRCCRRFRLLPLLAFDAAYAFLFLH